MPAKGIKSVSIDAVPGCPRVVSYTHQDCWQSILWSVIKEKLMEEFEARSLARFEHLLKTATLIAETNPRGLVELVRAILRPLQSEYLLGVAERGQDAMPTIESGNFFGEAIRDRIFTPDGMSLRGTRLEGKAFNVKLARDVVLPWAWDFGRYVNALATIGSSKAIANKSRWDRVDQGTWCQDENHQIELWLPWGIGFVNGGNHSITAGILGGEGEVTPDYVFDMAYLFDDLRCDGRYYLDNVSGERVEPIKDVRRAAVFEIGRMMQDTHSPAFRTECEQAQPYNHPSQR